MSDTEETTPSNSPNNGDELEEQNNHNAAETKRADSDDFAGSRGAARGKESCVVEKSRDLLVDTSSWSEDLDHDLEPDLERGLDFEFPKPKNRYSVGTHEKKLQLAIEGIKVRGKAGVEELYYLDSYMKNAELMDVVNKIDENGIEDLTVEERTRFKQILKESITKAEKGTAKSPLEKEYEKFVFGAVLAYVLLVIWLFSIFYFTILGLSMGCKDPDRDPDDIERIKRCKALYGEEWAIVQNITFGLVTAVAISQFDLTGTTEQNIQERFKAIRSHKRACEIKERYDMRSQGKHVRLFLSSLLIPFKRIWMFMIYRSQQIFVIAWILGGLGCLFFTVNGNNDNPLFSTGQTWLGVAITKTYTYFGVQEGDEKSGSNNGGNSENLSVDDNERDDKNERTDKFRHLVSQLSLRMSDVQEEAPGATRWE